MHKKLKLVGYPRDIVGHTAFIEKMFNSKQEAQAFSGAELKTVSGNRGILKKGENGGLARAKFEEKVKISDIIILKTWVKVKIDQIVINYDN